ncbi:MAG: glyoxalase, partial [Chloroflexota bacterium]|nr:glyoxalase [Chloroflexota bacterium]
MEFSLEKLGFEKRLDAPFGEGRWLGVAPAGATTSIALVPTSERAPIEVDTGIRPVAGSSMCRSTTLRTWSQ